MASRRRAPRKDKIGPAVVLLRQKVQAISDPKERAAVVRALRAVSQAVEDELKEIRAPGPKGGPGEPWVWIPNWI